MIANKRFVFLHYPKTGGTSLTEVFARAWDGPFVACLAKAQNVELSRHLTQGSTIYVESAHQNLAAARVILKKHDLDICKLDAVYLGVRNPYALVRSRYLYQRRRYERGKMSFKEAASLSWPDYVKAFVPRKFEQWMRIDGETIPNLKLIRLESMQEDLNGCFDEAGVDRQSLKHINKAVEPLSEVTEKRRQVIGAETMVFNAEIEEVIYKKYKTLFELGIYERSSEFV